MHPPIFFITKNKSIDFDKFILDYDPEPLHKSNKYVIIISSKNFC